MEMILGFLPTVVFAFIVWFITQVLKTILHKVWPQVQGKRTWRKLVLQSLPVVIGCVLAFAIPVYPFPEHFMNNSVVHGMFGAFVGYLSGHIYSAIKYKADAFVQKLAEKVKKMGPSSK